MDCDDDCSVGTFYYGAAVDADVVGICVTIGGKLWDMDLALVLLEKGVFILKKRRIEYVS